MIPALLLAAGLATICDAQMVDGTQRNVCRVPNEPATTAAPQVFAPPTQWTLAVIIVLPGPAVTSYTITGLSSRAACLAEFEGHRALVTADGVQYAGRCVEVAK